MATGAQVEAKSLTSVEECSQWAARHGFSPDESTIAADLLLRTRLSISSQTVVTRFNLHWRTFGTVRCWRMKQFRHWATNTQTPVKNKGPKYLLSFLWDYKVTILGDSQDLSSGTRQFVSLNLFHLS
jgi:hypothetical protein